MATTYVYNPRAYICIRPVENGTQVVRVKLDNDNRPLVEFCEPTKGEPWLVCDGISSELTWDIIDELYSCETVDAVLTMVEAYQEITGDEE